MKVDAIKCESCGDTIYSRARHDMRWCTCGNIAIDGGRHYLKMCFKGKPPESFDLEVDANDKQLYDDWNKRINKYGRIKKEEIDANL